MFDDILAKYDKFCEYEVLSVILFSLRIMVCYRQHFILIEGEYHFELS